MHGGKALRLEDKSRFIDYYVDRKKISERNASKIVCQTIAKFYLCFSQIDIVDTYKLLISFRFVMNAVSIEH